eukprot:SAG31_NODE_7155_length_1772_cov_1.494322_1_plen_137_part_00
MVASTLLWLCIHCGAAKLVRLWAVPACCLAAALPLWLDQLAEHPQWAGRFGRFLGRLLTWSAGMGRPCCAYAKHSFHLVLAAVPLGVVGNTVLWAILEANKGVATAGLARMPPSHANACGRSLGMFYTFTFAGDSL